MVPGLNLRLLLSIPEKAISLAICLDEPSRVFLRARQVVTLLHHPPPFNEQKRVRKTGLPQRKKQTAFLEEEELVTKGKNSRR